MKKFFIRTLIFLLLAVKPMPAKPGTSRKTGDDIVKIGLVGDVMIGRSVNDLLKSNPKHDIWGTILPVMQQQDLVIANLETAVTNHEEAEPKVFNFKTDSSNLALLKKANIKLVNLANNHTLDYGLVGFRDTLTNLEKFGINHVGAGLNAEQARAPYKFQIKGVKFALFGFTDNEPSWKATADKPGTNYISVGDEQAIDDIKAISPEVDVTIVTLHWGPNMREYPSANFIDYAHRLVDAGADIIAGHSAHILQGIEVYKSKLIIYDMGDFIDDYMIDRGLRNDLAAFFSVTIKDKKVVSLNIYPTVIQKMVVNKATRNFRQVLSILRKRSDDFTTKITKDPKKDYFTVNVD